MKITDCPLLRFRTKATANAVALHVICLDPAGDPETENPWENPWENAGKCWENDWENAGTSSSLSSGSL